jgi:hypothetical protein
MLKLGFGSLAVAALAALALAGPLAAQGMMGGHGGGGWMMGYGMMGVPAGA